MNSLIAVLLSILLLTGLAVKTPVGRYAFDWYRLRTYHPQADIAGLAATDEMTDYGRKLFFLNRPEVIADKIDFRNFCSDDKELSVLGCYRSGDRGIFIFGAPNFRLGGLLETVAAHEVLHAGYERLSTTERNQVDELLEQFLKDNPIANHAMDAYRGLDQVVIAGERHSIIGTEVGLLPEQLEQYYARYFNNRTKIVGLHTQYQSEFEVRDAKIKSYDGNLAVLAADINSLKSKFESQAKEILDEQKTMDGLVADGNVEARNGLVPEINGKIADQRSLYQNASTLIKTYNDIVSERNRIALESRDLLLAIDTRQETPRGAQ